MRDERGRGLKGMERMKAAHALVIGFVVGWIAAWIAGWGIGL